MKPSNITKICEFVGYSDNQLSCCTVINGDDEYTVVLKLPVGYWGSGCLARPGAFDALVKWAGWSQAVAVT